MAFPVLIGWALVVSLITGVFTSLFSYLAQFLTKRLLIVVTSITVLIAITTAFFLAIDTLMQTIIVSMPTEVSQYIGLFLPSNFTACMSAIVTAKLARWAYDWKRNMINIRLS